MTTKDQILSQIDELVATHTFGLDALEGIKKIKDSLDRVTVERDNIHVLYNNLLEVNGKQSDLLQNQVKEIAALKSQVSEMQKILDQAKLAIYEAEKHKAVAETWQSAMAMVFKPNIVRDTVQRQVAKPVEGNPGGNGYYPTAGFLASANESETIVRENG
jgi:hypothetical protein